MGRSRLNCAQAVFKAFAPHTGMSNRRISYYSNAGHGCAPDGECGALFAARRLVGRENYDELERLFVERAGAKECRTIRKTRSAGCGECVEAAGDAVREILKPRAYGGARVAPKSDV
jgi:hypothetical protein